MEIMPQVFVFEKKLYKAETNGSKMIKFGENHPKMGAMCRLYCDQAKRSDKECECKAQSTSESKVFGFSF